MRTLTLAVATGIALITPALRAQVDPEAKRAIDQMVEAITKAKTLSYQIEAKGIGGFFELLPTTKAEVIAARVEGSPGVWKMRINGRATARNVEPTEVLFVSDGTKRTWIDYPNKAVLERSAPDQGEVGQAVQTVAVREIFEAQPLSKERVIPTMKMEAPIDLDGVKCEVVLLDPGQEQNKTRYSIATTDHLPRRIEMIIQGSGIDGRRVSDLTKVKVDLEPPPGTFAISTPDGFSFNTALNPTPAATPTGPAPKGMKDRAVGPNVGELAPDFTLTSSSGEKVQLYGLRGQVVLVDFFGTWNLSSKRSTAELEKIAKSYGPKQVKVFGLAVREASDAAPTKFFKDNNLTYTLLLKGDEAAKAYRVKKYPTLFVIGRQGEVVYSTSNYDEKSGAEIRAAIDGALTGEAAPTKEAPKEGDAARVKGKEGADADK